MSHLTKVKTQFKDLQSLEKACNTLGLDLVQNATIRIYHATRQVAYGVMLKDSEYDLGFEWDEKQEFLQLVGDSELMHEKSDFSSRGKGGRAIIGEQGGKLTQEYIHSTALQHAMQNGFDLQRVNQEDGSMLLRLMS